MKIDEEPHNVRLKVDQRWSRRNRCELSYMWLRNNPEAFECFILRKGKLTIKESDCVAEKLFNILTVVTGRPKRLLMIVNPFGGGGVGRKVYKNTVEPLLKASGISYTMRGADFLPIREAVYAAFVVDKILITFLA